MKIFHTTDTDMQDILIVGGGINGAGIARDAAGRGLKVTLCEQDDLAAYTSSASSKLIHGGLRYLETYQFGLVRKSLQEREVLMRIAPHLIHPLRFNMPHEPSMRPSWMLKLGLFIYDHLAKRELIPASSSVNYATATVGASLHSRYQHGYAYSDARVHDGRLTVLNVVDAYEHGAKIYTRTKCESLQRFPDHWVAVLAHADGTKTQVQAKTLVNAAGPWAHLVAQNIAQSATQHHLRLVKGSHIVVKRSFEHEEAYIFQNHDGRIVFALPFENHFTLIGTTDFDYQGDAAQVRIDEHEIAYLCDVANHYFKRPIQPSDVIHHFSGVRALPEPRESSKNASKVPRDYILEVDKLHAPIVHVLGGKITTYRKLAEDVMDILCPHLHVSNQHWTGKACLPGGDLFGPAPSAHAVKRLPEFVAKVQAEYPHIEAELVDRWVHHYGQRVLRMLPEQATMHDLGKHFGHGLFEIEVLYLIKNEFAQSAEDILWRRTWLGMFFSQSEINDLNHFISNYQSSPR